VRITVLKVATAALVITPIAAPAALRLVQPSSAAVPTPVQNYTTPQEAGCPTATASATPGSVTWRAKNNDTTYNASGKTFTQDQNLLTAIAIDGSNTCLVGGTIAGSTSKTQQWGQLTSCCNGNGVLVNAPTKLLGVRLDDISVDAVRVRYQSATRIDDMYASYIRDDCVSDLSHANLVINDSLFDGCHTGISWQSNETTTSGINFQLQINDSLFYIQPMAQGTGGTCDNRLSGGLGNGAMWKMEGSHPVDLHNVVIRQDLGSTDCVDEWPAGTYDNVTFVWGSASAYPGTLPAGVTLTRDLNVWDNAKAAWLARHSSGGSPSPSPTPTPTPPPTGAISKVLLVVEENHNAAEARPGMPYLAAQASTYGDARNFNALADKSLPNYLAIAGGSMFGVTTDIEPSAKTIHGASLFSQLRGVGKTAKSYMESMPVNCDPSKSHDPYSNHHNPWLYFDDDQANCKKYDVPLGSLSSGALASDVSNGLPNFSLVVPDKLNDAHDSTLARADNWLKDWLTVIKAGPDYKAGRLAIIVTFDEGSDASPSRQVLTVVISPYTSKVVSTTSYNHYSLLRTLSDIFGVTPLRNAATARSMRAEFHI
jgi:phosphatidylinositol-3-phosphatase